MHIYYITFCYVNTEKLLFALHLIFINETGKDVINFYFINRIV